MTDAQSDAESQALPEASFLAFCSGLASQALMQLGELPFPDGERHSNIPYARYTVDVLRILRDKTDGNRTDEETAYLDAALGDLERRVAAFYE
jgi:hypothetical protein